MLAVRRIPMFSSDPFYTPEPRAATELVLLAFEAVQRDAPDG
jgi:hypothetical protein